MTQLSEIVQRFDGRRVVLVGDFMLDQYVFGDAERISPEAPVPVLRITERQDRVGGAGSVALNVVALGAEVSCFGLVGSDAAGARVRQLLQEAHAGVEGLLTVGDRPTITKTRLTGLAEHRHRQQILRLDDEVVRPPTAADHKKLLDMILAALPACDVVCLEDYAKGLLTAELCQKVITAARDLKKPVYVDPARTPDWNKYRGVTLLTPNRAEFEVAVGWRVGDDELADAAKELIRRFDFDAVVVTLGRDGAKTIERSGRVEQHPTVPRAVYDNTGAGDAVLAMMAVSAAAGASLDEQIALANIAGGLEVSKFGCVPITRDEVLHELHHGPQSSRGKVRTLSDLRGELDARRQRGETVVFTNGVFDILHPGHVELIERAKQLGSILVVGVNSDASARSLGKGDDRPIRRQEDRARMIGALQAVDYVIVFDEPDPKRVLRELRPEILAKGGDYQHHEVVGYEIVEAYGGRIARIDFLAGYNTSAELERIRSAR